MRLALIYGSTEGQTAKIAEFMAGIARKQGVNVSLFSVKSLVNNIVALEDFDGIIIGASVHVGQYQPQVVEFVKAHIKSLQLCPTAFYSVSLTAKNQQDPQVWEEVEGYIRSFLTETGWTPSMMVSFAGALRYSQYDFFKRLLLRWISAKSGGDTDTSRDYEYTDWDEVQRFTEQFIASLTLIHN